MENMNFTNEFPLPVVHAGEVPRCEANCHHYVQGAIVKDIPLLGQVRILLDSDGLKLIGIIFALWVYATFTTTFIILVPRYYDGHVSIELIAAFLTLASVVLLTLFRASTINPGVVPHVNSQNLAEGSGWIQCKSCVKPRPPKAHHCRRCGQCVLRMDHHCPWINNCVGEGNHYLFILLLLYGFIFGLVSFILCMLHYWVFPKCIACDKDVFYIRHSIWFMYGLTVLAGVMTNLLFFQVVGVHLNLMLDRTTIDNMENPHPDPKRMQLRSCFTAYADICGTGMALFWLFPCRRKSMRSILHYTHPV